MTAHFNGPDYDPSIDLVRLTKQHERIRDLMLDGVWRTLEEIADATGDPPASVSAQLRHLRKVRFGSFIIEKRPRGAREKALYEYRLLSPNGQQKGSDMHVQSPLTRLVVDRKLIHNEQEIDHQLYEGEVEMSQQQQDYYKSIIGDGLASVTVSRTLSHKNYGSGGDVFISVTLKCDQSGQGIATAIEYAKQLVESRVWPHHEELRQQLVQRGILTQ